MCHDKTFRSVGLLVLRQYVSEQIPWRLCDDEVFSQKHFCDDEYDKDCIIVGKLYIAMACSCYRDDCSEDETKLSILQVGGAFQPDWQSNDSAIPDDSIGSTATAAAAAPGKR